MNKEFSPKSASPLGPLPSYFEGKFKPHVIKRKQPLVTNLVTVIGGKSSEGIYTTSVKVWSYQPTYQYPDVRFWFSINNGKNSAYCPIDSQSLKELADTLAKWSKIISTHETALKPISEALNAQIDEQEKSMEKSGQLANLLKLVAQQQQGGNGYNDNDFDQSPTEEDIE